MNECSVERTLDYVLQAVECAEDINYHRCELVLILLNERPRLLKKSNLMTEMVFVQVNACLLEEVAFPIKVHLNGQF